MTNSRRWAGNLLLPILASILFAVQAAGQTNAAGSPVATPTQAPAQSTGAAGAIVQDDNERIPFMTQRGAVIEAEAPSAAGLLIRTMGALLLIVGLIVAAAWGLRRFGGAKFGRAPEDAPELAVIATLSLGDRRSLSAVRFGDRLLLIGSTPQAISLLANTPYKPARAAPRARSVADLLQEDREDREDRGDRDDREREMPSFEASLEKAMVRRGGTARR